MAAWFFLGLCFLRLLSPSCSAQSAEIALIKSRVLATLSEMPPEAALAEGYRASLRADGNWADIDLASTAQTNWPGRVHLERIRAMARAYVFVPGSQGSASLRSAIFLAYDTFVARDPKSTNWWYQSISTPQNVGEILLLMGSEVSSARLTAGLNLVARSYVARSVNTGTNTGSNRVEQAYGTLLRGLLTTDAALTAEAYLAMGDTVLVNSASTFAEGIQPDGAFHQHGPQIYDGGYGFGFAQSLLKFGAWGAGTSLGFDARQLRVLVDYLLDGPQWLVRGDTMDYTATGRALSRSGGGAFAPGYLRTLDYAADLGGAYRRGEIDAFRVRLADAAINAQASTALALTGNRQFWSSDMMVHHRPGFLIGLKTSSTRTFQPETGNGESLKCLHLGDGVTLIQQTGNEYDDIMPLWDWRHLPGTTTQHADYALKPATDWGVYGTTSHAGGASDGEDGAASFAYGRLGVSAKKSWFFLGDVMVALGADIAAPTATLPVMTTLDQCRRSGVVTYCVGGVVAAAPSTAQTSLAQPAWVNHRKVGYFFLTAPNLAVLDLGTRTGTWQAINTTQGADPVSADVFSLQINHGTAPAAASYAYLVAPGLSAEEMPLFPVLNWEVLRNDSVIQAVKDHAAGQVAFTFWASGTSDGVTCSGKANLLVTRDGRFIEVALADPTQSNTGSLTVTLSSAAAGLLSADTGVVVEQLSPALRLRFNVAKSFGRTFTARFFVRPNAFETVTLSPSADSYVHDASPTTNFGTASNLVTKLITTSSGWTRESYLRFDLSPLGSRVPEAARLRLSTLISQSAGLYGVQALAPNAWSETGVTWSNRPRPVSGRTALWSPVVGDRVSADVLTSVLMRGSSVLDLAILPYSPTSDGLVSYASREGTDGAARPLLELVVPRPELALWREEQFGSSASDPVVAGDSADPDGDGLPNLLEFVFGGNPLAVSGPEISPRLAVGSAGFGYSYRRSHASGELILAVESSANLTTWSPLVPGGGGVDATVQADGQSPGFDLVRISVPRNPGGRMFFRLRVSVP